MSRATLLLACTLLACTSPRPSSLHSTVESTASKPVLASAESPYDPPEAADETTELTREVREAVRRALPFVTREGHAWMEGRVAIQEGSACVSCHHVGYAIWAHAEARRSGLADDDDASRDLLTSAVAFLSQPSIPRAMSVSPILFVVPAHGPTLLPDLLTLQEEDGSWAAKGQFPTQRRSNAESDAVATAYTLLAVAAGGHDDASTWKEARDWLASQPLGDSVERVASALLLADAVGDGGQASALREALVARQREDGGWGWTGGDDSDAFSTGQALYALARTGQEADGVADDAIEAGQRHLVASQGDDGTWSVPSAMISREPSPEKDVIYEFWGAAWAAIGLSRSLDGRT